MKPLQTGWMRLTGRTGLEQDVPIPRGICRACLTNLASWRLAFDWHQIHCEHNLTGAVLAGGRWLHVVNVDREGFDQIVREALQLRHAARPGARPALGGH